MIVRKLDDGSMIIINQTDHARLAGAFAAHWGNDQFMKPAPRESLIRAAATHDNGWLRYETMPAYDAAEQSSPSFFQSKTDAVQLEAFGWAIDWMTNIDPYAGALIGRHRTGLYRGRYGAVRSPASSPRDALPEMMEAFVLRYERQQGVMLAGPDRKDFLINYQLLQFWDLLSLAVCLREPRDEIFEFVPMNYEGDGSSGVRIVMTVEKDNIRLLPYPFDVDPLTVSLVYRRLPCGFPDEAAFRAAYFGAPPLLWTFTFR
jgi:hypothetical protein